jgi:nucleoside-diphosphate-sugar epimerase
MYSPPDRHPAPAPADCALDARLRDKLIDSDSTLVVLGGSGWMGRATLAMLDAALDEPFLQHRLLVFGSSAAKILLPSGRAIACAPLSALAETRPHNALLLHYAYATKDKLELLGRAGFLDAVAQIRSQVDQAIAAVRPRGIFFPSSGAVYAPDRSLVAGPEANLYGWMKRADEAHLAERAAASGARLRIGRIFTMAGAFINKTDLYAIAAFLNDIKAGGPIRIHAAHRVLRSYAHVVDVINLALAALLDDSPATPATFDVAGRDIVEVGDLAALCRAVCGCPAMPILRPPLNPDREDRMLGDADQYESMLAAHGLAPTRLEDQIRATAHWLGAC